MFECFLNGLCLCLLPPLSHTPPGEDAKIHTSGSSGTWTRSRRKSWSRMFYFVLFPVQLLLSVWIRHEEDRNYCSFWRRRKPGSPGYHHYPAVGWAYTPGTMQKYRITKVFKYNNSKGWFQGKWILYIDINIDWNVCTAGTLWKGAMIAERTSEWERPREWPISWTKVWKGKYFSRVDFPERVAPNYLEHIGASVGL